MSSDITLKHTDQRLIEVLRNINPHRSPYTAALGKEAANKIIELQRALVLSRLREFYRDECEIRQWMTSPQPLLGFVRADEMIAAGYGDDVLQLLHQLEDGAYV